MRQIHVDPAVVRPAGLVAARSVHRASRRRSHGSLGAPMEPWLLIADIEEGPTTEQALTAG
jgi:hypothetical protein